ncbi:hypothetical protein GCM10027059_32530 [Myceligenerans halotolerans]
MHDVLSERAGSGDSPAVVAEALRAAGHDLPGDLVGEAVASFADTAPAAVAEHLSPFTTAYGLDGLADPADLDAAEMLPDGLALLASAPAVGPASDDEALPGRAELPDDEAGPGDALAFGTGAGVPDDDAGMPDGGPGTGTRAGDAMADDDHASDDPAGNGTAAYGPDAYEPADDDEAASGGLTDPTDVPPLPHDSVDFVLGDLDTQAPDDAFDPAELDAADGEDTDIPL